MGGQESAGMICGPDELGWTGGNPAPAIVFPAGLEPGSAVHLPDAVLQMLLNLILKCGV